MRKTLPFLAAGGVAVLAVIAFLLWSGQETSPPMGGAGGTVAEADPGAGGDVAVGPDDMVLGQADAPITIIEYASLTCPHCARFHEDTLPALKTAYIETGKARLVFRDFPLDGLALRAAMLPHCAGKARYFGLLDVLFRSQSRWATDPEPVAALEQVARIGGIGKEAFASCLQNEAVKERVVTSRLKGDDMFKIESTPTFIINGRKYPGAMPFSEFDRILRPLAPDS